MLRPILTATIGYLTGIILGLYFENSIVLFCILIAVFISIFFFLKLNFKFLRRYSRYIKLIINFKVIIIILIFSLIGYTYTKKLNDKYNETYEQLEEQETIDTMGIITSNKIEKEYQNVYEIKIEGKKFYCYVNKNKELEFGDKVKIKGTYQRPEGQRNLRRI